MDEILSIGRSKRPNAVLRRAAAQRSVLIQDVSEGVDNGDGDDDVAVRGSGIEILALRSDVGPTLAGPKCVICRIRASPYTCPQCNIPYCSLTCFRMEKHASCAGKFAQQMMRGDQGDAGDDFGREKPANNAGKADEAERQKMLEVLQRMQSMGTAGSSDDENDRGGDALQEQESDEGIGVVEADVRAKATRAGVELDNASTDELLALLSAEERARFQAMTHDNTKSQGTSDSVQHKTLFNLLKQTWSDEEDRTAWWRRDVVPPETCPSGKKVPKISTRFKGAVDKLRNAIDVGRAPAKLEWNIVALMLVYVYVIRHLDVNTLQEAGSVEQTQAREVLGRLLPYLVTSEDMADAEQGEVFEDVSRTLLSSAEEVTLWIVAQLGGDAAKEPASTMQFLHEEVLSIVDRQSNKVVVLGEAEHCADVQVEQRPEQRLFSDVRTVLPNKASQRKLAFYAAYWSGLVEADLRHNTVTSGIRSEVQRLQAEMKRTQDEERWRAAHEMIQQSGSILVPPPPS